MVQGRLRAVTLVPPDERDDVPCAELFCRHVWGHLPATVAAIAAGRPADAGGADVPAGRRPMDNDVSVSVSVLAAPPTITYAW